MELASKREINEQRLLAKAILLQMNHIKNVDIEVLELWLDAVEAVDPYRIVWHARRCANWGGSEVGTLVQSLRNLKAIYVNQLGFSHNDVETIVKGKLLLDHPVESTGPILGGIIIEPYIIKMYVIQLEKQYESVVVRDDIKKQIADSVSLDGQFGVRMDPDLCVELDGRKFLVDMKAPSESSFKATLYSEPLAYQCQLNIGFDIARNMEEPYVFDGLLLAVYDHSNRSVKEVPVDIDQNLIDEIYDATSFFTPFIERGEIPPTRVNHLEIRSHNDLPDDLIDASSKASAIKLMMSALSEQLLEEEARIARYTNAMTDNLDDNFKIEIGPSLIRGQTNREFLKEDAYEHLLSITPQEGHSELFKIKNNSVKLQKILKKRVSADTIEGFFADSYEVKHALSLAKSGAQFQLKQDLKSAFGSTLLDYVNQASEVCSIESQIGEDRVPTKQKWDLINLKKAFDAYKDDQVIHDKTKIMLEDRLIAYDREASVNIANKKRAGEGADLSTTYSLKQVISSIQNEILEPLNAKVPEKAKALELEADSISDLIESVSLGRVVEEDKDTADSKIEGRVGPRLITM